MKEELNRPTVAVVGRLDLVAMATPPNSPEPYGNPHCLFFRDGCAGAGVHAELQRTPSGPTQP